MKHNLDVYQESTQKKLTVHIHDGKRFFRFWRQQRNQIRGTVRVQQCSRWEEEGILAISAAACLDPSGPKSEERAYATRWREPRSILDFANSSWSAMPLRSESLYTIGFHITVVHIQCRNSCNSLRDLYLVCHNVHWSFPWYAMKCSHTIFKTSIKCIISLIIECKNKKYLCSLPLRKKLWKRNWP